MIGRLREIMKSLLRARSQAEPEESGSAELTPPPSDEVAGPLLAGPGEFRWRPEPPRLIFVGSGHGGVGKTLISSNLTVILAALSRFKTYAVDFDLDSQRLSLVLQPPGHMERFVRKLLPPDESDYLTFASILLRGGMRRGLRIPLAKTTCIACNGQVVPIKYGLIPALNILRIKEQLRALRGLRSVYVIRATQSLLDYFAQRARNEDIVVVLDGKQKSLIGTFYEPLYSVALDRADVFLLPVMPPLKNFTEIVSPYLDYLDKLIIIANQIDPGRLERVKLLVRDALDQGVPVFLIPRSPVDGELFSRAYTPPALKGLSRPTSIHTMVIAQYLGLLDQELVERFGCAERLNELVRLYMSLFGLGR